MSQDWLNLTWSEKTWWERVQTAISFTAACVVGLGMFIGMLLVLGLMIDNAGQYREEHDRCLKRSTNGYEIRECR